MKSKIKIALVTVWFPPQNAVAVNRMYAFAKYLGEDFDVDIFTVGDENKTVLMPFGEVHYLRSNSMLDRFRHVRGEPKIKHNFKTIVNVLATKIGASKFGKWRRKTERKLIELHKTKTYDIIISSFSPVEPHDIAFQLKSRFSELIWIADMRDEMSQNPYESESVKKRLKKKELAYAGKINAITTVSKPILDGLKEIFDDNIEFLEIRNGFDHNVKPLTGHFNEELTFAYAGTFYGKRKPDIFLEVLSELIKKGEISDKIKLQFIGTNRNFNLPSDLLRFTEFIPQVEYVKAVELLAKADCNLLINPPMGTKGQFSGKIFDYISVQKPILAMLDKEDVAAELIMDQHAGFCANFYDKNEIEKGILFIYDLWKNKKNMPFDPDKVKQLHRKNEVAELKNLILRLINKN